MCQSHMQEKNLEKLEKPFYKGKGKLTSKNIVRFTTAIRCATRMRSQEQNAKQLRQVRQNQRFDDLKYIIRDVSVILNIVAAKADRLIGDFTTNLAERWMAIRAKFDG
ncbi:hypothetical protein MAR_030359, partial [Mya arenaria]